MIGGSTLRTFVISVVAGVSLNLLGVEAMKRSLEVLPGTAMLALGAIAAIAYQTGLKRKEAIALGGALLVLLVGAALFGAKYIDLQDALLLCTGSVALAGLLAFSQPDEPDVATTLVHAVVWLGVATVAFGMRKGFGMGLALASGAVTFIALNKQRALLAMGPLLGLVVYRVFREANLDATRSLDIGQHYALIGLLLGAMLPLLPGAMISKFKAEAAGLAYAVSLIAVPVLVLALLDAKGVVGLVAGVGLSAVIAAIAKEDIEPFAGIGVLSGASLLAFPLAKSLLELTREDKVRWMWIAIAIAVVVGLIIKFVPKTARIEEPADAF